MGMDLSSVGVLLLDNTGKIVFSNPLATELLRATPDLKSPDGAWLGPFPPEGSVEELDADDGKAPCKVSRTRLTNCDPSTGYVGLLVGRAGLSREQRRARLQEIWAFTPAELRLAEVILDGMTPDAAASSLGVTIHTVRTYLKRLYRRAGVHSQATLVCALNRSLN